MFCTGFWNNGYGGWLGNFMFLLGPIFMVAVLALIVYGVIILARRSYSRDIVDSPLDILEARYASGEITKKDFLAKKKDLGR